MGFFEAAGSVAKIGMEIQLSNQVNLVRITDMFLCKTILKRWCKCDHSRCYSCGGNESENCRNFDQKDETKWSKTCLEIDAVCSVQVFINSFGEKSKNNLFLPQLCCFGTSEYPGTHPYLVVSEHLNPLIDQNFWEKILRPTIDENLDLFKCIKLS